MNRQDRIAALKAAARERILIFDGSWGAMFQRQGLGDAILFSRFVAEAAGRADHVTLMCPQSLVGLLERSLGCTCVSDHGAAWPAHDAHVPLMSLPHALGTTMATIPTEVPYLKAAPAKAAEWRKKFAGTAGLKVGIVWAGSPGHRHDRMRSLPAELVLPRLLIPGVQLFSLQKEPRADDRTVLERLKGQIVDLEQHLANFADTAAAVSAMDLVISVDTAVAHLAGALGKPTWILLPHILDWRWLYEREDSPWYPTARLFRQTRSRDIVKSRSQFQHGAGDAAMRVFGIVFSL